MKNMFIALLAGLGVGALIASALFFGPTALSSASVVVFGPSPTPEPVPTPSPTPMPRSCVLPAGFTCYDFTLELGGRVSLDIGQANGRAINITAFGCSQTGPSVQMIQSLGADTVAIHNGQHETLLDGSSPSGKNYAFSQCCPSASGSACQTHIAFNYSMTGSSLTRTAYGEISGPVP